MKSALPFLAVLIFASCTTAYKAGQTPDDVYFSPARPQQPHDEYVRSENRQPSYQYNEQREDDRYLAMEDDRYLRMKVRNRRTWSDLDYYYSDPYAYNYYNRFNNYNSLYYNTPWNYYSSWNYYYNPYNANYNPYYYNPYGSKVVVVNPRPPVYNRPRTFNMNVYNPAQNNSYNPRTSNTRRTYRGDNRNFDYNTNNKSYNSDNNSRSGSLRNTFGTNNSNSSTQQSNPTRSDRSNSTPSPAPSRGSNAPTRKF